MPITALDVLIAGAVRSIGTQWQRVYLVPLRHDTTQLLRQRAYLALAQPADSEFAATSPVRASVADMGAEITRPTVLSCSTYHIARPASVSPHSSPTDRKQHIKPRHTGDDDDDHDDHDNGNDNDTGHPFPGGATVWRMQRPSG